MRAIAVVNFHELFAILIE